MAPILDNVCSVAMESLIMILLRPSREMVRLINSSPWKGSPKLDSNSERDGFSGRLKRASTLASFDPLLIRSADALPPKMRFTAFMIMDFPAPVSPDRILSPGLKLMSRRLMMAKLEMVS